MARKLFIALLFTITIFSFLSCSSVAPDLSYFSPQKQPLNEKNSIDCDKFNVAKLIVRSSSKNLNTLNQSKYKSVYDTFMYRVLAYRVGDKLAKSLIKSMKLPTIEKLAEKPAFNKVILITNIDDKTSEFLKRNCKFKGFVGLYNQRDLHHSFEKRNSFILSNTRPLKIDFCLKHMLAETAAKLGANTASYLTGFSTNSNRLQSFKSFSFQNKKFNFILMKNDYFWDVIRTRYDDKRNNFVYDGVIEIYSSAYYCPDEALDKLVKSKNSPFSNNIFIPVKIK